MFWNQVGVQIGQRDNHQLGSCQFTAASYPYAMFHVLTVVFIP